MPQLFRHGSPSPSSPLASGFIQSIEIHNNVLGSLGKTSINDTA